MFKGKAKVDADSKLLQSLDKLPAVLSVKVDVERVQLAVIDRWIETRMLAELGFDDDILTGTLSNKLREQPLSAKDLVVTLGQFLTQEEAVRFVSELWTLLADAQTSGDGVPAALVEAKKREIAARSGGGGGGGGGGGASQPVPDARKEAEAARTISRPRARSKSRTRSANASPPRSHSHERERTRRRSRSSDSRRRRR
jgi:hypothetical protein